MAAEPIAVTATNKFKIDFNKIYSEEKGNSDCGFAQLGLLPIIFLPHSPTLEQILAHGFMGTPPTSSGTEFSKELKWALNCKHTLQSR